MGLVCQECGDVVGDMIDIEGIVEPLKLQKIMNSFICTKCLVELSKKAGVKGDSPENWDKIVSLSKLRRKS